jgi:hypothetical protein
LTSGTWPSPADTRRVLALLAVFSAGAAPAQEGPRLAVVPLEFGSPGLAKFAQGLRGSLRDAIEGQLDVTTVPPAEMEATLNAVGAADYGQSDETLARVAYSAGALYGVHVGLRLESEDVLVAIGRVVRNDGKAMGAERVRVNWGRGKKVAEKS